MAEHDRQPYSSEEVERMRTWVKEFTTWGARKPESVDLESDEEIVHDVDYAYPGGLDKFIKAGGS